MYQAEAGAATTRCVRDPTAIDIGYRVAKSDSAEVTIDYALNQGPTLALYVDDGGMEVDHSAARTYLMWRISRSVTLSQPTSPRSRNCNNGGGSLGKSVATCQNGPPNPLFGDRSR
jgi:hypothetical protein